jgi:hypothetical protein
MNTIVDALMLALAFLVIVAQLPGKRIWVSQLWVIDAVMFGMIIASVLYVSSTRWALTTVYAGFMFTVLLRIVRSIFWRKYSYFTVGDDDNEEKERV